MTVLRILPLLLLLVAPGARAERIDGVAAVVNGEIITLGELFDRTGPLPDEAGPEARTRRSLLLRRAADDAVADKLMEKEAEAQGILPTEADLDATVEDVKKSNNIDDTALDQALAQQGMTRAKYRQMLRLQLTRMKIVEFKVKQRVTISEDDVKLRHAKLATESNTRTEVRVRDVFVPSEADPAGAKAKVEAARKRVQAGAPFATVARETGGPLADRDGEIGWVSRGTMLPDFEEVAFGLKPGQMSEVFEVGGGYHLLLVEEQRSVGGVKPLAEAREEIRQQLMAERLQKATEEYLGELRKTADVELRLP
jgi:peptidyl-prolyl cis-trans isomerase SurA